jgi:putative oxidoreductase
MAGHGAQKLFGAFGGPGLQGTGGIMHSLGLQPGQYWGAAAALSEFCGGTLTALGLLDPLGPIATISAMSMATGTVHWGKPIWVTSGGAELPLVYGTIAASFAISGPGKYSVDHVLGLRLPAWVTMGAAVGAGALVGLGLVNRQTAQQAIGKQAEDQAGEPERRKASA